MALSFIPYHQSERRDQGFSVSKKNSAVSFPFLSSINLSPPDSTLAELQARLAPCTFFLCFLGSLSIDLIFPPPPTFPLFCCLERRAKLKNLPPKQLVFIVIRPAFLWQGSARQPFSFSPQALSFPFFHMWRRYNSVTSYGFNFFFFLSPFGPCEQIPSPTFFLFF